MSSAFDIANRSFLAAAQISLNVPNHMVDSLMRHYSTTKAKIKDGLKDVFPIEIWGPQGSSLSGLIFILRVAVISKLIPSPSSSWAELVLFSAVPVRPEQYFLSKIPLRLESKSCLEWLDDS